MMQVEIRKERIKKYGSFLWCPERSCLCFGIDTPSGVCKYDICLLDNPEYIAKQAEIDRRIQENAERERLEKAEEKAERQKPIIRRQTKTKEDILNDKIERLEYKIQQAYRRGRTREGDALTRELLRLNAEMRKIK